MNKILLLLFVHATASLVVAVCPPGHLAIIQNGDIVHCTKIVKLIENSEKIKQEKSMIFHDDIYKLAQDNTNFRKVVETGEHSQLVLMSLLPGEEIGEEVHSVDQILIFLGDGQAVINGEKLPVKKHDLYFVKAGIKHNFINSGKTDLKLFTIYAPAQHKPYTTQKTKS